MKNTSFPLCHSERSEESRSFGRLRSLRMTTAKNGYTLVEFLVTIAVVIVIGATIVSILSSTLRGTKKTNVISLIRTTGNQALTQMSKLLKFAKKFEGVSKDNSTYFLDCRETDPPPPMPVKYKYVKFIAEDDTQVIFSCDDLNDTIASNGVSLIDTSIVKVASSNGSNKCWFSCDQDRLSRNPIIGVRFQLRQAADTTFAESQFSIPFETSVVLKNLVQ